MKNLNFITLFHLSLFSVIFSISSALSNNETKQQKIERFFELNFDQRFLAQNYDCVFANANILDENKKKEILNKFLCELKTSFIKTYDQLFNENEIDDLIAFYSSPTGNKYVSNSSAIAASMQGAFASLMNLIQQCNSDSENQKPKSNDVIYFEDNINDKNISDANNIFKSEINQPTLTIVKFSASWCPPCKAYAPIFEQTAAELKELSINGKKIAIKYISIDTNKSAAIANEYSVSSIPTTIFFKNGKIIYRQTGLIQKNELIAKIKELAFS